MTTLAGRLERILQQQSESSSPIQGLLAGMSPATVELLRRCAITHQFTAATLAVLDPSLPDPQQTYERLSRMSVTIRGSEGLALHDHIREALFREWLLGKDAEEFAAISSRLYDLFLRLSQSAKGEAYEQLLRRSIFHQFAFDRDAAMAAFDRCSERYRRDIRYTAAEALIRVVREYEPAFRPTDLLCVKYNEARLATLRGDAKRAIGIFDEIAASRDATPLLRAHAQYQLGRVYLDERDFLRAQLALGRALTEVDATPDAAREQARIVRWLGVVARETGDLDRAVKLLQESADSAAAAGDELATAAALNALGGALRESGDLRRALEKFENAAEHLRERPFDLARVYHNLGTTYMDLREFERSDEEFRKSLALKVQAGDTVGQACTWSNLAHLYQAEGRIDAAVEAATNATSLFEEALDWYNAGCSASMLVELYVAHDPAAAQKAADRALEAYRREGDRDALANARHDLDAVLHPKKRINPWILLPLVGLILFFALLVFIISR